MLVPNLNALIERPLNSIEYDGHRSQFDSDVPTVPCVKLIEIVQGWRATQELAFGIVSIRGRLEAYGLLV